MKFIDLWLFLVASLFLFQFSSAELSNGSSDPQTNQNQEALRAKARSQNQSDLQCPETLKEWVQNDSRQGAIFDSANKLCKDSVSELAKFNNSITTQNPISSPIKYTEFLAEKFSSKIHPNVKEQLKGCLSLSASQNKSAQTKLYSSITKIEAVQNASLGEIAFIDSILPPSKPALSDLKCENKYFPETQKKCESLNGLDCKTSAEERFKNQVVKTERVLKAKVQLLQVFQKCKAQVEQFIKRGNSTYNYDKNCGPIEAALQVLTNQTPWVNGDEFNKIAQVQLPNITNRDQTIKLPDSAKIEEALKKQLAANRKAKLSEYAQNENDFTCLTGIKINNNTKADCDFEDVRERISKLPDLTLVSSDSKNPKDIVLQKNLTAESCLLKEGQKQQEKINTVKEIGTEALFTGAGFLSGGVGFAVGAAGRSLATINRASKLRRGSILALSGASTLYYASQGLDTAITSCSKEADAVIKATDQSSVTKENICADPNSQLEQAKEEETNCLVDSLLSSVDVLPFLGTAVGLLKLTKPLSELEKIKILESLKDPKQRELVEKLMKQNGSLNDADRIKATEYILGKKLRPDQQNCIIDAHNVGVARGGTLILPGTNPGEGSNYSADEISKKKSKLTACGIIGVDQGLVLRAALAGSNSTASTKINLSVREDSVLKALGLKTGSISADAYRATDIDKNTDRLLALARRLDSDNLNLTTISNTLDEARILNPAAAKVLAKSLGDDNSKLASLALKSKNPKDFELVTQIYSDSNDITSLRYLYEQRMKLSNINVNSSRPSPQMLNFINDEISKITQQIRRQEELMRSAATNPQLQNAIKSKIDSLNSLIRNIKIEYLDN